eukprot:jgi/Tetstr1/432380/TSEL_021777.t1
MSSSQAASGRQVVGAARGERVPLGGLQPVALKARPTGPNKRPALPLMLPAQQPKKAKVSTRGETAGPLSPVRSPHSGEQMRTDLSALVKERLREASDYGKGDAAEQEWLDKQGRKNPAGGYLATYVKRDFELATGYALRPQLLGASKLGDLLRGLTDICFVKQSPGGHLALYPPGQASTQHQIQNSKSANSELRFFLEDKLAEYALWWKELKLSEVHAQFLAQRRDAAGSDPPSAAALLALLRAEYGPLVSSSADDEGEHADPLLKFRADPMADLLGMLSGRLARPHAGEQGQAAKPRYWESGYPMECVKNDFKQAYRYTFRHELYGYSRLVELLGELAGHAVVAAPNPAQPKTLVLRPAPRGAAVPVHDLRRLLIERMRALKAADAARQAAGRGPASYFLGSVKPDFLRRYGYAFAEKPFGFQRIADAVAAQSDICELAGQGSKTLQPAPGLRVATATGEPTAPPSAAQPSANMPAAALGGAPQPRGTAALMHAQWEAQRRVRHGAALLDAAPQLPQQAAPPAPSFASRHAPQRARLGAR